MITTGVLGGRWRASVDAAGGIHPWDGGATIEWFVAADDRWHVPSSDPTVRQRRIGGTPVVETRVRIPSGDAVQRVYSVPESQGLTVIEFTNESPLPIVVAVSGAAVLTGRHATTPIQGIDLPPLSVAVAVGHRATVRLAVVHGPAGRPAAIPAGLPDAQKVATAWSAAADRAGRLSLPDDALVEAVTASRCELLLAGIDEDAGPGARLLAVDQLVRLGEPADDWLLDVAEAVALVARARPANAVPALAAARRVLVAADDRRAVGDLDRMVARLGPAAATGEPTGVWLADVERSLVADGALLPGGIPAGWLGQPLDVHGLPDGRGGSVGFALRWHGTRPALLWEQLAEPTTLSSPRMAPGWQTDERRGETLWPVPGAAATAATVG